MIKDKKHLNLFKALVLDGYFETERAKLEKEGSKVFERLENRRNRIKERMEAGETILKKEISELNALDGEDDFQLKIIRKKAKDLRKQFLSWNDSVVRNEPSIHLPDNLRGRSIYEKVIPTVCNLKNLLSKLIAEKGNTSKLKPWEERCYKCYQVDKIAAKIINAPEVGSQEKEIIRNHILQGKPSDIGANCIDIYLVAYVSENYGLGKEKFFEFIREKGISKKDGSAQAIWQVGKGDGVFLEILNEDGTVKDKDFFVKWLKDPKDK